MADGRTMRKAKVVIFIDRLERDRKENFQALVSKAKLMKLQGFETLSWDDCAWLVASGRLVKLTGKSTNSVSFNFAFAPKLGAGTLKGEWREIAKALFVLRFHRKHQSTPNQRSFITAIGYVSHAASELGQGLTKLTPEALDNACSLISRHYSESTAYNLHKHVAEFAAHCDVNGLCRTLLQYRFSKMRRPSSAGGLGYKRLDDPETLETKADKLIYPDAYRVIGELYLNVPENHKYRLYVLMLTLLACTGRRFSEISLLLNQQLSFDDEGSAFIEYFPKKSSRGDAFTPKRRLYLPSEVLPIVSQVLSELVDLTSDARSTAMYMVEKGIPDMRFLEHVPHNKKLFKVDLQELGG
tara:strand:+ start:3023 stop:4087 length:1065 start_codon:yes stop_codon:yes gene_type:complete